VRVWVYLAIGAVVWFCVLRSGIHATLAGVLVSFTIPARSSVADMSSSPLHRLEHGLHPWVAWLVVPVFAFANAGVSFGSVTWGMVVGSVSAGIMLALLVGKQFGILTAVWLSVRSGLADLPEGMTFRHIHGIAVVCGVGFTMSLFIGSLAFFQRGVGNGDQGRRVVRIAGVGHSRLHPVAPRVATKCTIGMIYDHRPGYAGLAPIRAR
jgi:NhaA family Na+:H+ antiporter